MIAEFAPKNDFHKWNLNIVTGTRRAVTLSPASSALFRLPSPRIANPNISATLSTWVGILFLFITNLLTMA